MIALSFVSRPGSGRSDVARAVGAVVPFGFRSAGGARARGRTIRDRAVGRTVGERANQAALSGREIGVDLVHRARCLHGVASTSRASTTIDETARAVVGSGTRVLSDTVEFNYIRVGGPKI